MVRVHASVVDGFSLSSASCFEEIPYGHVDGVVLRVQSRKGD